MYFDRKRIDELGESQAELRQGFQELDFGYAAAASTVLFLFTALATAAFLAWRRRGRR